MTLLWFQQTQNNCVISQLCLLRSRLIGDSIVQSSTTLMPVHPPIIRLYPSPCRIDIMCSHVQLPLVLTLILEESSYVIVRRWKWNTLRLRRFFYCNNKRAGRKIIIVLCSPLSWSCTPLSWHTLLLGTIVVDVRSFIHAQAWQLYPATFKYCGSFCQYCATINAVWATQRDISW